MIKRVVILEKIKVNRKGDSLDRGELFWELGANSKTMTERPRENPYKVKNGQIITLGNTLPINLRKNDILIVEGYVGERDKAFSSDEMASFRRSYSYSNKFGLGNYVVPLKDGNLDVLLYFRIEVG